MLGSQGFGSGEDIIFPDSVNEIAHFFASGKGNEIGSIPLCVLGMVRLIDLTAGRCIRMSEILRRVKRI